MTAMIWNSAGGPSWLVNGRPRMHRQQVVGTEHGDKHSRVAQVIAEVVPLFVAASAAFRDALRQLYEELTHPVQGTTGSPHRSGH